MRSSKFFKDLKANLFSRQRVSYVTEDADWVIRQIGLIINEYLEPPSSITTHCYGLRNKVVHFGSINTFFRGRMGLMIPHHGNKTVVTWFHVSPGDDRLGQIPLAVDHVDLWHTACTLTKDKLVALGIPAEKIVLIPLGVNCRTFSSPSPDERISVRRRFGIAEGQVVIGSYQKDGNGWGEGLTPKLIKGPDLFCDVVEELAREIDLFVLLTGPARGYVKKRLQGAGIPYHHEYLENPDDIAAYYKATDLYVVASREEGGPKQILESMASGVPVVSTRVGMAPDLIVDGENGLLVEVEDTRGLIAGALRIIRDEDFRRDVIRNGLATAPHYEWEIIARRYELDLYQEMR